MKILFTLFNILYMCAVCISQGLMHDSLYAAYKNYQLTDSFRIYKPQSEENDALHYRPVLAEIWYPSEHKSSAILSFGELLGVYESYASSYQEEDYAGLTKELAEQLIANTDSKSKNVSQLLVKKTDSYKNIRSTHARCPVIIYMAGQNGAGFENYPIFEHLAKEGYVVVAVWSVGQYPGYMSNSKEDMMEQVHDAEFILRTLAKDEEIQVDTTNLGVIGYSWGGVGAAVLNARHPGIKAVLSLDGTENYYSGNSAEEDQKLRNIQKSAVLQPQAIQTPYFYLESDGKLNGFIPTSKYDYYEQKVGEKWYVRFIATTHEDFSCLPSLLNTSQESSDHYRALVSIVGDYFNKKLRSLDSVDLNRYFLGREDISTEPLIVIPDTSRLISICGNVIDKKTKSVLPYVNLGIPNKNLGTVSNENGVFYLYIPRLHQNDTVRISCVGYRTTSVSIKQLLKDQVITLEANEERLQEVVIQERALKKKIIGNRTTSKFITTPFGYKQLGAEMGVRIPVKQQPVYLDAFNFNVPFNNLHGKAIFRLNIYSLKDDKSFQHILKENILIPIEQGQTGKIRTSLKPYHIVLNDDVIISLEWVGHEGDLKQGEHINFSLGFFNNGTYVRYASQSEMEKKFGMGVGFNLEVRY